MGAAINLPPLIIERDLAFLNELRKDPRAKACPPIVVGNDVDAEKWITSADAAFGAIVLNPEVAAPAGVPLIRLAFENRPATPLVLIVNEGKGATTRELLEGLAVSRILQKPLSYTDLLNAVRDVRTEFRPDKALELSRNKGDALDSETEASERDFLPILARNFVGGAVSFFDVYVRMNQTKFLKILQAGDAFTPERLNNYLEKGVVQFYLRKETQEEYLKYCDRLTSVLLKKRDVPTTVKATIALNQGQETLSYLKANGMNQMGIDHAEKFVSNVKTLVNDFRPGTHSALAAFHRDLAAFEHGVSTTMISALLIQPLSFTSEKSAQIVGIASLLHDISLQGASEAVRSENEEAMTPQERNVYRQHPITSASILASINGMDAAVIQAVKQHHERRNREGFPNRIGAGAMNRVAEIIGLAEEFSQLIARAQREPGLDPLAEMQRRVLRIFSTQLAEAFRAVFLRR